MPLNRSSSVRRDDVPRFFALLFVLAWLPGCGDSRPKPNATELSQSVQESPSANSRAATARSSDPRSLPSDATSVFAAASNERAGGMPDNYVGSQTCKECHADRHQTYAATAHSQSLNLVNPDDELVDREFTHHASHRRYKIDRVGEQVVHREYLQLGRDDSDEVDPLGKWPEQPADEILLGEHVVLYVMGSNSFAKGYLVTDGPFVLQSPMTWYEGVTGHGMAPHYDHSNLGFGRHITDQCMFCHAGMVSRVDQNPNLFTVHELAIGCERCHGPGAEHAKHYQRLADSSDDAALTDFHDTIVNPARLSRAAADSICAQCHCQGDAPVSVAGKQDWDFRPGQDFAATKVNFDLRRPERTENRFVGHYEQMRQSACYVGSETLTCITCHDPHQDRTGLELQSLHQQQCLDCHQDQSCKLDLSVRQQRNENQCVTCHMPKADSEVAHAATTNHRIGIHLDQHAGAPNTHAGVVAIAATDNRDPDSSLAVIELQDFPDSMSEAEIARMQAIGAMRAFQFNASRPDIATIANQAEVKLRALMGAGRADADVLSSFASLTLMKIPEQTAQQAETQLAARQWQAAVSAAMEALRLESKPNESRTTALVVLVKYAIASGRYDQAIVPLSELTRIRRTPFDWAWLGFCLTRMNQPGAAESALRQAVRIDGTDPDVYELLAGLIETRDPVEASRLRGLAKRIRQLSFTAAKLDGSAPAAREIHEYSSPGVTAEVDLP